MVNAFHDLLLGPLVFLEEWVGFWRIFTADTPIRVNTEHPVLLRIMTTPTTPLIDCPGLDEEYNRQPRFWTSTKRSAGTVLTSPPKKLPRLDVVIDPEMLSPHSATTHQSPSQNEASVSQRSATPHDDRSSTSQFKTLEESTSC